MSWGEYVALIIGLCALAIGLFNMASAGHGWFAAILAGMVFWGILLGLAL